MKSPDAVALPAIIVLEEESASCMYLFSSRQLTILKQMFFSPLPLFFLGLLDSKVGGVEWFSSFIVFLFLEGGVEEEYGS